MALKVHLIVGARPNFMKAAPLVRLLDRDPFFHCRLIHTGQHYDRKLSHSFFKDLDIRKPDINLNVGSGSQSVQTAQIMISYEKYLHKNPCDRLLVVGDVNSTLACSLVAAKARVPVAHIEAGLRSNDKSMPEEINRLVTDRLSDLFFVTEKSGKEHLLKEGVKRRDIHLVGNLMIDTLLEQNEKIKYQKNTVPQDPYWVLTLHRPSNVDDKQKLSRLLKTIESFSEKKKIYFPCHPRTRKQLEKLPAFSKSSQGRNLQILEPLSYRNFLSLWKNAELVLTDSGGLQEETTALKVPCITLRNNTERPITVDEGSNILVGNDLRKLEKAIQQQQRRRKKRRPYRWDGKTANRIIAVLKKN
jgi:UDP-N-acetylglucosamine 2-epimerase (non-hydrolysing)